MVFLEHYKKFVKLVLEHSIEAEEGYIEDLEQEAERDEEYISEQESIVISLRRLQKEVEEAKDIEDLKEIIEEAKNVDAPNMSDFCEVFKL